MSDMVTHLRKSLIHCLMGEKMNDNKDYKLSSIVLVYNGGKYLKDCINSLVNQTLDNMEIILVNDASTDDSLSICKEFAQNFSNVKVINKKENGGLGTSGNMGIKAAKGEYITLVDNDDIIPPYAYEKLYNKAIWLEKGKIVMQGDVEEVCAAYEKS